MSCAEALATGHRTWCALWGRRVEFCTCGEGDLELVVRWHVKSAGPRSRSPIFHGPDCGRAVLTRRRVSADGGGMTSRTHDDHHDDDPVVAPHVALDPAAVVAWWVDQATHGTVGDSGHEATGQD